MIGVGLLCCCVPEKERRKKKKKKKKKKRRSGEVEKVIDNCRPCRNKCSSEVERKTSSC